MTTVYTFSCERYDDDGREHTVIVTTEGETWMELAETFADFLRGCGFILPGGTLDFCDEPCGDYGRRIDD